MHFFSQAANPSCHEKSAQTIWSVYISEFPRHTLALTSQRGCFNMNSSLIFNAVAVKQATVTCILVFLSGRSKGVSPPLLSSEPRGKTGWKTNQINIQSYRRNGTSTLHVHMQKQFITIHSCSTTQRSCMSLWCTHLEHADEKWKQSWLELTFSMSQSRCVGASTHRKSVWISTRTHKHTRIFPSWIANVFVPSASL